MCHLSELYNSACDTADAHFGQLSIDHNKDFQYQGKHKKNMPWTPH